MNPCALWRCIGSELPGGYSTVIIRPSLPGKFVRSFEKSGVTFASLASVVAATFDCFADESWAAASRNDRAARTIPPRSRTATAAALIEGFDAGADGRSIAFWGVLSHSAKRIEPRRGLGPGTRL